jgi:hypothetical protein
LKLERDKRRGHKTIGGNGIRNSGISNFRRGQNGSSRFHSQLNREP